MNKKIIILFSVLILVGLVMAVTTTVFNLSPTKNNYYSFNGSNYINISSSDSLNISNATSGITLSAWVKLDEYECYKRIVAKSHTSAVVPYTEYGLMVGCNSTGTGSYGIKSLRMELAGDGNQHFIHSTTSVENGVWYQVTATYNNSDGAKIYINGILDNSILLNATSPPSAVDNITGLEIDTNDNPVSIGSSIFTSTPNDFFKGDIDEVKIFNRSLSTAEVLSLYNGGLRNESDLTVGTSNLVAYYPLNDSTDDYSGNSNDGINNGATSIQLTNTFDNEFNVTFSGNQNKTRWLHVDKGADFTSATFNLTGHTKYGVTNDGYKTGSERGMVFGDYTLTNGISFDWTISQMQDRLYLNDTTAFDTGCSAGVGNENYNYSQLFNISVSADVRYISFHTSSWMSDSFGHNTTYRYYIYDYILDSWDIVSNQYTGFASCSINDAEIEIEDKYIKNNIVQVRYQETNSDPYLQCGYALIAEINSCDGILVPRLDNGVAQLLKFQIKYTYKNYTTNPSVYATNEKIWNYSGTYLSEEAVDDFTSILDTAINSEACDCEGCVLDDNTCAIPITFHSDENGILEFSDISINWTEDVVPIPTINIPIGEQPSLLVSYSVDVDENWEIDTCTYWVTRGASVEVTNTTISCSSSNTGNFIVSSQLTNYVFHFFVSDTSGNSNYTNSSFSTISNATSPPASGGSGGIVIIGGSDWTMESAEGQGKFDVNLVIGTTQVREVLFENLGDDSRTLTLICEDQEGDGCKYITFEENIITLPKISDIKTSAKFKMTAPEGVETGSYVFNIVAKDDQGKLGKISVFLTVKETGFFSKLTARTEGGFPYLLIAILSFIISMIISLIIMGKLKTKAKPVIAIILSGVVTYLAVLIF